jgi:hypothetical protein
MFGRRVGQAFELGGRVANPLGFGFSKGAAGGIGYLGQHFSKLGQTFRHATARRVNEDTLTNPRVVFAANNLLPRWEPVARNIEHSRFHTLPRRRAEARPLQREGLFDREFGAGSDRQFANVNLPLGWV